MGQTFRVCICHSKTGHVSYRLEDTANDKSLEFQKTDEPWIPVIEPVSALLSA